MMEKDFLKQFLGKKVKVVVGINDKDWFYTGVLEGLNETQILIQDRYEGLTMLNISEIKKLQEKNE